MVHLYSNSDIAEIDRITIEEHTSTRELIYRAAIGFVSWLFKTTEYIDNVHIMCGPGNNGADGYCVALLLIQRGISVRVYSLDIFKKRSIDNHHFMTLFTKSEGANHRLITSPEQLDIPSSNSLFIDAIFGNGINRPVTGKLKEIMEKIQDTFLIICAVDVPSGLLEYNRKTSYALKAGYTFSFEFPKLSFFDPANASYVGCWQFGSIGLSEHAKASIIPKAALLEVRDIAKMINPRPSFAHKGLMGKALILTVDHAMKGAIQLVARGCVTSGAGYTYLQDVSNTLDTMIESIPEVILLQNVADEQIKFMNAVAIGPGLGLDDNAVKLIDRLLLIRKTPIVIDADALTIIGHNKWLDRIPKGSILTPHIKEFDRIFGTCQSHYDRINRQANESQKRNIIIVLKGKYTSISDEQGKIYYNNTGNPGLAKGGSGDVLTGMITGLLAQGHLPFSAATIGVFIHGLSADLALSESHEKAICPGQLHRYIGKALARVQRLK